MKFLQLWFQFFLLKNKLHIKSFQLYSTCFQLTNLLGWMLLLGGCPTHCRPFSTIPDPYPQYVSNATQLSHPPISPESGVLSYKELASAGGFECQKGNSPHTYMYFQSWKRGGFCQIMEHLVSV